jgi:metal-responsive CopG/Arc/MetJ family transcriptional regulator
VKVLISLEEQLVRRIDRAAQAAGLSRSAYISQLAKRELGQAKGPGANASAKAAMRRLDRLFASLPHEGAAAAVRAERDAR